MQESFYDELLPTSKFKINPSFSKEPSSNDLKIQEERIKDLEQQIKGLENENKELRRELTEKEKTNKKIAKESIEVCRNYLKELNQLRENSNKENKLNQEISKYSQKLSQNEEKFQNFTFLMKSNCAYKKSLSSKYETEMQLLRSNQEYVVLKLRQLEKICIDATQETTNGSSSDRIKKYIMEIKQLLVA